MNLLEKLHKKIYKFKNESQVKQFIAKHPEFIGLLIDLKNIIDEIFKKNYQQLVLEYDIDPEEGFEILTILIYTTMDIDKALKKLEEIDMRWWHTLNTEQASLINISVYPI